MEERVVTGRKAPGGGMQQTEVQCDCPASSAHELLVEPPSFLQRLFPLLFCGITDSFSSTAHNNTVAEVDTLLSPNEWRRTQEEGGDEGEFLGRDRSRSNAPDDTEGDRSTNSSSRNKLGVRKVSFLSYVLGPFSANADATKSDYVAVSTLSSDADDGGDNGDVELGDLADDGFTTLHKKSKDKNSKVSGKVAKVRAGGCGCGKGNCKCGVNCRCGEVAAAPAKVPRVL